MNALEIQDITKTYRIGVGRARIREAMPWPLDAAFARLFPRWWSKNTFNALEDVSISIPKGASVGIVGHNGAGKTTMLKVIAGVTAPNKGSVAADGRLGALIDVLVGFHPDLTGAENAYLLGAIHGLSRKEMGRRIHRILEFAEIDDLAETPVKRYSSGMQARLGFSTLVAIEPEILLIDEVLAVGDANFQRKCTEWLDEYRRRGGTLLFVSHNLGLVRSMTDRVLWLDHGKVVVEGETAEVLTRYARAMERRDVGDTDRRTKGARKVIAARGLYRWGAGGARVQEVRIDGGQDEGRGVDVTITYESTSLERAVFCVAFVDEGGQEIAAAVSPEISVSAEGAVRCRIDPMPFREGIYFPVAAILAPGGQVEDRWRLERAIVVNADGDVAMPSDFGAVKLDAIWKEGAE